MVRISAAHDPPRHAHRAAIRRRVAGVCITLVAVAAILFGVAVAGSERLRNSLMERSGATTTRDLARAVALAPLRFARANLTLQPTPTLRLDVKFKHMHRIHEQRDAALRSGVLATSEADSVPAQLDAGNPGGRTAAATLGLFGDRADALIDEKWPMQIETKGDDHVFGIRRLALLPPDSGDFGPADFFLEQLHGEEVVAARRRLVDVVLNGEHLGLMTLQELPALELLAFSQRRDGPFLRFDSAPDPADDSQIVAIAPVQPGALESSRALRTAYQLAAELVAAHFAGDLPAGELFDVETWGRFLALVEAWGAGEAVAWQNLRFYFNPLTARLEPVGVAVPLAQHVNDSDSVLQSAPFARHLQSDGRIQRSAERALQEITAAMAEDEFLIAAQASDRARLLALQREYPLRLPFDFDSLRRRAAHFHDSAGAPATAAPVRAKDARGAASAPLATPSIEDVLAQHPFLRWDPETRMLRAPAGRHDITGSLILPEDVGLALIPATVLHFEAGHGLIAHGPLDFRGREDAPIVLEGPASVERSQLWSGIYVVESSRPSHWTHVVVRNTGGFERRSWTLASGVVFRKSHVELGHCSFTGDRTDDAVNVVRGSFRLGDVRIEDAASDGFDSDYSQGSIRGGAISQVGGDGIDLGGSRVEIDDVEISRARDKAVAVGERSHLVARRLQIHDVGIGIASKNGSEAEISDSTLRNIDDVALVAYMNQPEYGPGTLVANGNHISGAMLPALAQTGNRVVLDGVPVEAVDAAVERLYKD